VYSYNETPTASFTINPSFGTTATIFTFDASSSTDGKEVNSHSSGNFDQEEDESSGLLVRWDWQDDGLYDTNYSESKVATHQYAAAGTYTIKLEVINGSELTDSTAKVIYIYTSNSPPVASFTISPTSGTTTTIFTFDANGSTDNEDSTSDLLIRWDWENDGVYDTNYSKTKETTHQYTVAGTYTVQLEVIDSRGWTNTATNIVEVN